MIKKLKTALLTLPITLTLGIAGLVPATVGAQADIQRNLCGGAQNLSFSEGGAACDEGDSEERLDNLITQVINIFSIVVGVISVIMIIIGGFKYITSGGDSGNVSSAKNTIVYAIIGLVIVALAQFIVRFVLDRATRV